MDLNLLLTLEALLQEQNVTKAAARLHLSQPAVSAQLARLRTLFDDPLLIPAHRGMTATAKALQLQEPLHQALNNVRATLSTHRDFEPATAALTVGICCSDYLQAALALPLAKTLRRTAPGVRIALRNMDPTQLADRMEHGDVDLALMTPQDAPPGLHARHLFDERYVLIGRRDHPQLRDGISMEDYARLEHIVVSLSGGGFLTPVDTTLAKFGYTRNVVLSAASFLMVPEMVSRSDFVALVPRRLVRDRSDAFKQLEAPVPVAGFAVAMLWHDRTHGHPGQRWIRETLAGLAAAP
ncbi:LysR family transcriptional regulator [Paludibacterium yongneupense]|uniref:LysR family transcriptional regulator n=1 Tax=Paludibacterium yongneupense TaxID=400061 RepID=UPI00041CB3F5|nr:LysR family transcriptional regulator [Paludibacterium yongneupense]